MKIMLAVVLLSVGSFAVAGQVKPTSNVLGDTAATADTLVLRDSSGNMAIVAADLSTDAVVTAKIVTGAVTTVKFYLDLPTERIACVNSKKQLGTCTGAVAGTGCTCS